MLGYENKNSEVDYQKQNILELRRFQRRLNEKKNADRLHSQTKCVPMRARHPMISPPSPSPSEADIPIPLCSHRQLYTDVSIQARKQKINEIIDEICAVRPLCDPAIYHPSKSKRSSRRTRSQTRISVDSFPSLSRNDWKTPRPPSSKFSNSTPNLSSLPKESSSVSQKKFLSGKNFIKTNAENVASSRKVNSGRESRASVKTESHRPGAIPIYLKQRKERWKNEIEEKERQKPDPDCPPGKMLLPESERVSVLNGLQFKMTSLMDELRRFPVRTNTLRVKERKKDIEEEFKTLDDKIRIYSRPKVYVLPDE